VPNTSPFEGGGAERRGMFLTPICGINQYEENPAMLSVATDYAHDKGCPEKDLRQIAEAGFTHIHWCHQWNTDFVYSAPEIDQIALWLKDFGLSLNDLHASEGMEKCWTSLREYERLAGVELVKNRIEMTARLGADVIIMHASDQSEAKDLGEAFWTQLWKSLDELEPCAREHGIRIAIENGSFLVIGKALERYAPDYVGFCYDSGHGSMDDDGLGQAEAIKDRLIAVHLHDNDGNRDLHNPVFSGTIDWPRLARMVASSSYTKPVSMELTVQNSGFDDEMAFLRHVHATGTELAQMVADARVAAQKQDGKAGE
jgi:sugar phosphate isomerase/epimerase